MIVPHREEKLFNATFEGNNDIVKILLESTFVDTRYPNVFNYTPLIIASRYGYQDVVKTILQNGANIESQDDIGETALINAALWGHIEIVELLLKNGANLNVRGIKNRRSPLSWAAYMGHTNVVKLLMKWNANPNLRYIVM